MLGDRWWRRNSCGGILGGTRPTRINVTYRVCVFSLANWRTARQTTLTNSGRECHGRRLSHTDSRLAHVGIFQLIFGLGPIGSLRGERDDGAAGTFYSPAADRWQLYVIRRSAKFGPIRSPYRNTLYNRQNCDPTPPPKLKGYQDYSHLLC